MNINQRVEALRESMKNKGIKAYIVPSADAHQSEYVADYWKCRTWISGFTGSAGTIVVTEDKAGLWTDGRYFIQAEKQLLGSGIDLFKMGQPGVLTINEWLKEELKDDSIIGFDGRVYSVDAAREMQVALAEKNVILETKYDLINDIWKDRPSTSKEAIFIHELRYAGKSRVEKLELVKNEMRLKGATHHLLTSLDDIAWLLNIRGNDVHCTPVVISYVVVSMDKTYLFLDEDKVSKEVRAELLIDGVEVRSYEDIGSFLSTLCNGDKLLFDAHKTNLWLKNSLDQAVAIIESNNITTLLKSVKDEVEIANLNNCQIKDGVAMVNFLHWLDTNIGNIEITEITADLKLREFRAAQEGFIEPSFGSIAAYKEHAAMMHYSATPEVTYKLEREGLFLLDSGGQYLDGTTDITRTMVLGPISAEMKKDFTLVLRGHIGLAMAKFLYGTTGTGLDILARRPLWEEGIDYKCGTGHGVGYLLSVHEGPQRISQALNAFKMEKGMITTNEPGIYKEGRHGIRIENTLLTTDYMETESGKFMQFETISYCPIDREGIDVSMLTVEERAWLNRYHENVYSKLSPYLTEEVKEWLKAETALI
ncbi:MAG: aminopeptidase P family protein [Clostridium sp.]